MVVVGGGGRGSPSIYIKLHQISREAELQDFKRLQPNLVRMDIESSGVSRFRRFRLRIWTFTV